MFTSARRLLMAGLMAAAVGVMVVPAQAQYGYGSYGYGDRDDRQAYRQGLRDGQEDAARGRRANLRTWQYRERDDQQAYASGYWQGYRAREANAYYGGRSYGEQRYGSEASAAGVGFQDGLYEGQRDRETGHSYRPTHSDKFGNADRGYYGGLGSKNYYKQEYRNGYLRGYEQGWNSPGYGRRY